jgi:hypothetical protein
MAGEGWTTYERLVSLDDDSVLTHAELRLVAFGGLRDEVNNGGFDQYFFNAAGDRAPDALQVLADLGLSDLADVLAAGMSVLGEPYPRDRNQRQERLLELGETASEALDLLDSRYFEIESSTDLDAFMDGLVSTGG